MEIQEELDKKQLEEINQKINEISSKSSDNTTQKINETTKQIKQRIIAKKKFMQKLREYKELPFIQLINLKNDINSLINPILFLFSNLEIITEFCLGDDDDDKKEMLEQLQEGNIVKLFIQLMENMRNKNEKNPNYKQIHQLFRQDWNNNYMTQKMDDIIRAILIMLEKNINIANNNLPNKYPNIITNNFISTLVREKKCYKCGLILKINEYPKYVIDLFLRKPEVEKNQLQESLRSIFSNLLSGENVKQEKCISCGELITITKSLKNLKNYLIINLNRKYDQENLMKFVPSNPLIIFEKKENEEFKHEYELISCLARINDDKNNNANILRIYFKNFINGKFYKTVDGKCEEFQGNIQNEVINDEPQILIYKRI